MRMRERVDCKEHRGERWLRAVGGSGALKPCESVWAAASACADPVRERSLWVWCREGLREATLGQEPVHIMP